MNELHNDIALRYKLCIVRGESKGLTTAIHLRALLLDISQLGYTLSGDAFRALRTCTESEFKQYHNVLVTTLKTMVGANVKYNALFKDFPNGEVNDEDHFARRFIGLITNHLGIAPDGIQPLSCGHVIDTNIFDVFKFGACPLCQHQVDELDDDESDRPVLDQVTPLKIIGLATEDDVKQIFTNLLAANVAISEDNRDIISDLILNDPSMFLLVPDIIPIKENIAVIAKLAVDYKYDPESSFEDFTMPASDILINNIKTATDILRLAVQLNDGDVSLAENTIIKLSNKERRVIMFLLNEVKHPEEDMMRYKMRWIRLAKTLHIGKFATKFPNAFKACDTLRNNAKSITTFNGRTEPLVLLVNGGDTIAEAKLLELLITRPGEFARRLDWMLRTFKATNAVMSAFKLLAADSFTTTMMLTMRSHFAGRVAKRTGNRYFMPKGAIAKIKAIPDERNDIDPTLALEIVTLVTNVLLERFSLLDNLGNVYVNPELKNYLVPMVQRNATKSLVTVQRGSQIPFEETEAVRMFLYWKEDDKSGTVDVDLSAISYNENWEYKNHISFTNLSDIGGTHSGDILSAPKGAAEFIDINLKTARENNVRYVVMNVISYSGQAFDTFECFAGVMGRDKVGSGAKFEPRTVTNKFDLAGDTRYNLPLILDLNTNQLIWADISITGHPNERVEDKSGSVILMGKSIEAMLLDKPNMYDLVMLHAESRASTIDLEYQEGKKYDTVFDVSMATETDDIIANWL